MWGDEVLEQVRAVREAQAARFDFNLRAIIADLRGREAGNGHPVVLPPPPRSAMSGTEKGRGMEEISTTVGA